MERCSCEVRVYSSEPGAEVDTEVEKAGERRGAEGGGLRWAAGEEEGEKLEREGEKLEREGEKLEREGEEKDGGDDDDLTRAS